MGSDDLRESMSKRAAQVAKGYGWEIIARRIITVYEDVIKV
jgi:glycosyltransferase involved in cell wall biosynthesis